MKNRYLLTVMLAFLWVTASSQTSYPMETVGTPSGTYTVSTYAGWANHGVLSFSGTAQVQNTNPSNNPGASGGGNIFFTNTVGTYLEITGFAPTTAPQSLDITFAMHGYNQANMSELILEYSTNGSTYTPLTYRRLFRNYLPPTPWDIMVSDPLPGNISFTTLKLRFRQNTNTQQFHIDDIEANMYYTLPVKLISFSGATSNKINRLQWKATSTDRNEHFLVERSSDGRSFQPIGRVNAYETGEHLYGFNDGSNGNTFYRLRLVDADSKHAYSPVIYLAADNSGSGFLRNVYPVPAKTELNTILYSSVSGKATITLVDMKGRISRQQSFGLLPGINNCPLQVHNLQKGVYILKASGDAEVQVRTIMIQ